VITRVATTSARQARLRAADRGKIGEPGKAVEGEKPFFARPHRITGRRRGAHRLAGEAKLAR
jgi:hypothetical protein